MTKIINDMQWFHELNSQRVQRLDRGNLPCTKTFIVKSSDNENVLSVVDIWNVPLQFICIPINKIFSITISVDENGIFKCDGKCLRKTKTRVFHFNKKYSIPQKISLNVRDLPEVVGIDLGTTRCCAAVKRRHGIETVALDNTGERLLPSYVSFDEQKEKCGQIVIDRLRYHAKSSVFDSKRIIGREFKNIKVDQSWPFEVIQDDNHVLEHLTEEQLVQFRLLENNNTFIKIRTINDNALKYPEEISAALLKHIKQKAEQFQGNDSTRVMITVPAKFTDTQKDSTCAAAILTGFEIVNFVPEPVAAAFGYLINQPTKNESFNFLLFDLGGGTLDACIFKCERNQIEILSQNGNLNLGGRDFDNILINYFSQKLYSDFGIEELGPKKYKLMLECQKIKENLSVDEEDFLDVEELDSSIEEIIEIKRKEFEELSMQLLETIKTCILNALNECKFKADNIDKILLVGGGSRMPMIKNLLQKLFLNAEHLCATHPDEIVAVGATYYAYYLNSILKKDNKLLALGKYENRKRK